MLNANNNNFSAADFLHPFYVSPPPPRENSELSTTVRLCESARRSCNLLFPPATPIATDASHSRGEREDPQVPTSFTCHYYSSTKIYTRTKMVAPFVFSSALLLLLALLAALVLSPADARSTYIARIPNGANVVGISAIGHVATTGGGARNQFGLAFEAAGFQWTAALCALDSDGDGQTNGQELGDPCCQWTTANAKLVWTTGVSHPGDKTKTANATLWTNIECSKAPTSVSAGSTNTTAANGAAGQLPSAVGMGITALLFAVTAALAVT